MGKDKYYNEEGKVGILISPGFEAGWSTWNDGNKAQKMLTDRVLVGIVLHENKSPALMEARIKELFPRMNMFVC